MHHNRSFMVHGLRSVARMIPSRKETHAAGAGMARNTKQSSSGMGSKAAKTLGDPNASATAKSLAASVLAQTGTPKQTGAEMEDKASQVLPSSKYSAETKALAGSALSQSNKKR